MLSHHCVCVCVLVKLSPPSSLSLRLYAHLCLCVRVFFCLFVFGSFVLEFQAASSNLALRSAGDEDSSLSRSEQDQADKYTSNMIKTGKIFLPWKEFWSLSETLAAEIFAFIRAGDALLLNEHTVFRPLVCLCVHCAHLLHFS